MSAVKLVEQILQFIRAERSVISRALLIVVPAAGLAGCSYPSNVANDLAHMGNPAYDECRRNADVTSDYGSRCAAAADPNVIAGKAEQARQAAEQKKMAAEAVREKQLAQQTAEMAKGYAPITFRDFVLDGEKLASQGAKVSLTAAYFPAGDLEILLGTQLEVIEFAKGRNQNSPIVPLLTKDASRHFRSRILDCRNNAGSAQVGCDVHILGTATMCALTGPFGSRQERPCISVDDGTMGGF